jgi:hypothetical protein
MELVCHDFIVPQSAGSWHPCPIARSGWIDPHKEDQTMKDRSDRPDGPNRHSELLNGKRPASDARLLRDIFQADAKPSTTPPVTGSAAARGATAQTRKRHDAHLEAKPTHHPGVIQWD